jgi:hypothetical protein
MHGRYHLAGLKLRPEEYSFMADVEHLVCTKGDLVRVSHDVPLWGLGWGRVRSVEDNGATVTAVHLDEALAMEAGKEYCVRFRNADGASKLVNIVFQEGSSKTIVPQDPLPPAEGPQAGDLAMFGERGRESALLLIRSIEPQADLTARIVAVDAAPEILQADQGPIPAFDSLITAPSDVLAGVGVPAITNIQSDERALIRDTAGILRPRILISLRPVSDLFTDQIQRLEVQWRLTGSDGPWQRFESPRYTTQVVIDQVESGMDYDLRLRWILFDGRPGNWALRPGYRVVGVTSPPPNVPGLMIQDGRLTWWYPQPPIDLAGFEVRWRPGSNPTWDSASPAHEGVITLNRFDVGAFGPGPKTFLVKAKDVAGNVSLSPAVVMTDLGDQVVDNVVIATDHQALNWPGDIQNGVVENGVVEADDIGTRVWTGNPSVRVFTGDPAHRFWESPYQTLVYSFSHVVDLEEPISGRPLPDPGLVIDLEAEGTEIRTEYRPDGVARVWSGNVGQKVWTGNPSAPAWSPLPAFMPWPGRISLNQRRRYDFRITIAGGMVQGRITALAVWIDVPDREESIEDAAVSASGTRLALVQDYLKITVVNLTLQDDGGTARTLRVVDKNPAGPLIEALDGSGNRTTAVVDARIQGF